MNINENDYAVLEHKLYINIKRSEGYSKHHDFIGLTVFTKHGEEDYFISYQLLEILLK